MIKVSITAKHVHSKVVETEIHETPFELCTSNLVLVEKVAEAVKKLNLNSWEESPKITIKATMEWQP